MGLIGSILGGLANAALDAAKDAMGIGSSVGILFENHHLNITAARGQLIEAILFKTSSLLGIGELSRRNRGKTWDIRFFEDTYENNNEIDAFVISNGRIVVSYGLCGMGQCVLSIEGENIADFVRSIAQYLSELDFDNIQLLRGDIPFHQKAWIAMTKQKILNGIQYENDYEEDADVLNMIREGMSDSDNDEYDVETSLREWWGAIKTYLAKKYNVGYDKQFDLIKINFSISDGRSQLVMVGRMDTSITIFSYIGSMNTRALQSATTELTNLNFPARIICDNDGHYILQCITDMTTLGFDELNKLLEIIANAADYFEQKYVGGDSF